MRSYKNLQESYKKDRTIRYCVCYLHCFGMLILAGLGFYSTLHLYGEWVEDTRSSSGLQLLVWCHTSVVSRMAKVSDYTSFIMKCLIPFQFLPHARLKKLGHLFS